MRPGRLPVLGWLALFGAIALPPAVQGQGQPPCDPVECAHDDWICTGDILVTDVLSEAVFNVYRETGRPELPGNPVTLVLGSPRGIAIDPNGFPFVTQSDFGFLFRLNPASGLQDVVFPGGYFIWPDEVLIEPSSDLRDLLVVDALCPNNRCVWRVDPVAGSTEDVVGSRGTFGFPMGIALDEGTQSLYVADGNAAIWRVDLDTQEITAVATGGLLQGPHDVAIIELDGDKQLLVSDPGAQAVFRVDPDTGSQYDVAAYPDVVDPLGLFALDDEDAFLVADFEQSTILRFAGTPDPEVPGGWRWSYERSYAGNLSGPWSVTVVGELCGVPRSDFLVADTVESELYRVSPTSASTGLRQTLSSAPELVAPAGVAVDSDADASKLVCDASNEGLWRVDPDDGTAGAVAQGPPLAAPNRVVVHEIGGQTVYFVADPGAGAIVEVLPNGSRSVLEACGEQNYLVEPVALAIDHDGQLLVLNDDVESGSQAKPLVRVSPVTGFQQPLFLEDEDIARIVNPVDLVIDENGDLLLADGGDPDRPEVFPIIWRFADEGWRAYPRWKFYDGWSFELQEVLFHTLEGIALDASRELLVTDSGDPDVDPAVIRVNTTANNAWRVDIEGQGWERPNGIALDQPADPPGLADLDGDTVIDSLDNCQDDFNPGQENSDGDEFGDACDTCPTLPDVPQDDTDGDGIGDACEDLDDDGDGWPAIDDNCPWDSNADQANVNEGDGPCEDDIGDACQPDDPDGDGWPAGRTDCDNCRNVANPDQMDTDSDGFGNACDNDYNNDGLVDVLDYIIMAQEWGNQCPPDPPEDCESDANGDTTVDVLDYILMAEDWGQAPGPGLLGCNNP